MAVQNIILSVTQTEYVIDFSDFADQGNSSVNITIPSATAFRSHYRNRELPSILVIGEGSLSTGDSISITITDGDSNLVLSKNVIPSLEVSIELRTLQSVSSLWHVLDTGTASPIVPPLNKEEVFVLINQVAVNSEVIGSNFLNDDGGLADISFSTTGAGNTRILIEGRTMTVSDQERLFIELEPIGVNTATVSTSSDGSGTTIEVNTKGQGGGDQSLDVKLHVLFLD